MRSPATLGALLALALAAAPAAHGQGAGPRLGLEVNGGVVLPLGGAADRFDSGTQLGANLLVNVTPAVGVYAGYSQTELPVSDSEGELTWKGFEGGVRFSPALMLGPVSPTLTLGATYLKPEASGGQAVGTEGERGVGYRAGVGFDVPLGQVLTASLGGSVTFDPEDKLPPVPDCPPSDPDCDPDTRLQVTVGLRVYPPFLGRGPGR
jgi:hypothetical protein